MLQVFEGWDKLLSVEELLPLASQQEETALSHAANRESCPLQSSQAFVLGAGLAAVVLVILLFLLTAEYLRLHFCLWLV